MGERIDRLDVSLRGEMTGMRDGLRGEIAAMGHELRGEMAAMRDGLRVEMVAMRDELRIEFRDGLADNRRHTEVLFESLRDDIRLVAEAVAHLAVKIDQLQR